ncbi:hypothetical protein HW509_03320 [Asaia spathodeae]|uniref:hypothetical protein n=1 Tax=Asaia spathodeae TaxID=657016 RepID=UPI002FC2B463
MKNTKQKPDRKTPTPRNDGKTPIRTDIRTLSRAICERTQESNTLARIFSAPFAKIEDNQSSSLIPNAMKEGFRNIFATNNDVRFFDEMTILVPNTDPNEPSFPVKRIDYVIVHPKNNKCIVIELKTAMGFDSYAAALVEFMLLHCVPDVSLKEKGPKSLRTCAQIQVDQMDMLYIICSVNFSDSIKKWAPLLTKNIPLTEKENNVLVFEPFRRVAEKLPSATEASDYIETFLAGLLHWLDTGIVTVKP